MEMTDTTNAAIDALVFQLRYAHPDDIDYNAAADALTALRTERDVAYARGSSDSAGYISRAIDAVTSGDFDISDPRIDALCEYADAILAITDAPPVPVVGVKPLVWHEGDEPGELKSGPYDVWCELGKFQCYYWSIKLGGPHENADDAVAFLNAHHRARILAALLPQATGGDV